MQRETTFWNKHISKRSCNLLPSRLLLSAPASHRINPKRARGLGASRHTAGTELHPSLKVLPY